MMANVFARDANSTFDFFDYFRVFKRCSRRLIGFQMAFSNAKVRHFSIFLFVLRSPGTGAQSANLISGR